MGVQRQEELPVGEPLRELMRRVHREGSLADPGHPADGVDPDHPAAGRIRKLRHQLPELSAAASEAGDIAGQGPGGRRRGGTRRNASSRCRLEQRALRARQAKRIGEQPGRFPAGRQVDAPLQVADRPRAQARRFGQFLLRQPGITPQPPQQAAETRRRLLPHRPNTPSQAPASSRLTTARHSAENPASQPTSAPATGTIPVQLLLACLECAEPPRRGRPTLTAQPGKASPGRRAPRSCGSPVGRHVW